MTIARLAIALLMIGVPLPTAAEVSTTAPAAVLVFPLISFGSLGEDTLIELANTDAAAVSARCVFENPTGSGDAAVFTPFTVRLMADQPVGWLAGRGLETVPGDGGSIPALTFPFTGVLRCVAADANGKPVERNALVGSATIERFMVGGVTVDSARYNATGLAVVAGASNGDDQLVLGGPAAEYDACPASLILPSFLDGAVLDLGAAGTAQRTISTTVALVTCAQRSTTSTAVALGLSLTNEFGETFTTAAMVREQLVTPLSQLDTGDPSQSIFGVGMQGSPSAVIHIAPLGSGGILGIALSTYAESTVDLMRHSVALLPHLEGAVAGPDLIDLVGAPTVPPGKSPTATPTGVVPTAAATATSSATVAPSSTATLSCAGDCNGDGKVTISELIIGVNIVLGSQPLAVCPSFDSHQTGHVTISDLVVAVNHVLLGC